jgi:hypothetical protein
MPERRHLHTIAAEHSVASLATARPDRIAPDVTQSVSDGLVMDVPDDRRHRSIAQPEQDGHRLRRGEGQVVREHLPLPFDLRREHGQEHVVFNRAVQPIPFGRGAKPYALRLAAAGVVVLLAAGDVVDVVARVAVPAADLADREHIPQSTGTGTHPRSIAPSATACRSWGVPVLGCGPPEP